MKKLIWTSTMALAVIGIQPVFAENGEKDSVKLAELQEVIVKGVRAKANAPFAVANLNKKQLNKFSKTGRELPFLLSQTPGVVAWSENGVGTGTSSMRIRGAGGSRINITLDGVPLNSPEDQTVFWANMNSYGSLLGSAQIQRGIGTSTNGDGAFGGSVSLSMAAPSETPALEVTGSYGSFNTYNVGANFSTGLFLKHLIFNGAYHETATDGYLHGTSGRSGSYYGGLTWLGDNFTIRYRNVGNFEKTGQAWNGVVAGNDDYSINVYDHVKTYEEIYQLGLGKFNPLYEDFIPNDKGWTIGRYKYNNGVLWDKTTDNFYQNHNILTGVWKPNAHWSHNLTLHYTYGYGYYKEFRHNYKFAKFGIVTTPFVKKADFVRRKGLRQHTYGLIYTTNFTNENWDVLGGVNLQQFKANHFGYLDYISVKTAKDGTPLTYQHAWEGDKYYDSDADKNDYSAYIKATRHFTDNLEVFGDIQYRHVDYTTDGINDRFYRKDNGYVNQPLNIDKHYNFLNPKAGVSYHKDGHKAYFSVAYAGREPERSNFTDNGSKPAPKAEHLLDFELGYEYNGDNWHAGANFYYMDYHNQLGQTGEKSDIGKDLTTNIKKSYRLGVELNADWSPASWFTVAGNAALSQNKIQDFNEVVETYNKDWDAQSPTIIHYNNSTLAFSPSVILNGFIEFHYEGFRGVWYTNFVSRQYLDNTANKDRSLPSYSQSNINLSYTCQLKKRTAGLKEVAFGVNLNNIFDHHYAANGWVYSAIVGDKYNNDNRYYQIGYMPMAGFAAMCNVTLRF